MVNNRVLNLSLAIKMLKLGLCLCVFLPKMSAYRTDFDETKCIYFLIKNDSYYKNVMKFGRSLKIASRKNLIIN